MESTDDAKHSLPCSLLVEVHIKLEVSLDYHNLHLHFILLLYII